MPLAGSGAVLWAQSDATTSPLPHADGGPDALEHRTLAELARLYADVTRRGPCGENARTFAARIRTMAVYHAANGRSDRVRQRVAALVSERGREAVIETMADPTHLQGTLRVYGVEAESTGIERFLDPPVTARVATLDRILAGGEAALFERAASVLDRAAPSIDAHMAALRPIRLAQVDDSWCAEVAAQIDSCSYASALLSFLAGANPEFEGGQNVAWLATIYMTSICLSAGCI